MSILIRDMEMPKNCGACPLRASCIYRIYLERRPDYCPLVEVQPHGRLIDAEKLGLTDFEIILCQKGNPFKNALEMLLDKIENAQTIIEAEEKK